MRVLLIGPSGAGKTRLAARLAAALGTRAQDLDQLVEAAAGRAIPQIFRAEGEPGFRTRERAALLAVAAEPGVLATGAGVVLDPENRALLRASGTVVFLSATPNTQRARLVGAAPRPLLANASDPLARLTELYAARLPLYREIAHHELATDGRTPPALVAALIGLLRSPAAAAR